MLDVPASWLEHLIDVVRTLPIWLDESFPTHDVNLRGLLATLLVCFICGGLGSLVVGNRMAFFSDALAHCAFAGVGLGLLVTLMTGADDNAARQQIVAIMVLFGVTIGLLIAFVREQTGLASDTVIGVFYAGSIGLGAVIMGLAQSRRLLSIEDFIFGNPTTVRSWEVILLLYLAIVTAIFLFVMYNWLVLASANPSLALSRRVPVKLCRYLFIVLLALMVNLSQQITGTLLINGMLIVPAAAAANVAANLRQLFWWSVGLAMLLGLAGNLLSWDVTNRLEATYPRATIGISGSIIVLSALVFAASVVAGRLLRRTT